MLKYLTYFFLFFFQWLTCQELPPIQNYTPSDYRAENQNWAISQAEDKVVYLANNKGLLRFNGADWTLFPSPNESIMRSVNVVGDKIYTGCYMEFGYWSEDGFGRLEYTSLSSSMEESLLEDEEFWGILNLEDWIVFQSLKRIYVYNNKTESINIIDAEDTLFRMFKVSNEIYFQENGKGIFKIDNGKAKNVYKDDIVLTDEVINIFKEGDTLCMLTKHHGFYREENGSLTQYSTGLDKLPNKITVYSGIRLKDGKYALGTISNGLVLLDQKGRLVLHTLDDVNANKLCRIDNKTTIKGGSLQLNLHDGTNIIGSNDYKAKDSLILSLPGKDVVKHIKYEVGNLALIIGGKHTGEIGTIKEINKVRSSKQNKVSISGAYEFDTVEDYVVVIGESEPEIKLGGEVVE